MIGEGIRPSRPDRGGTAAARHRGPRSPTSAARPPRSTRRTSAGAPSARSGRDRRDPRRAPGRRRPDSSPYRCGSGFADLRPILTGSSGLVASRGRDDLLTIARAGRCKEMYRSEIEVHYDAIAPRRRAPVPLLALSGQQQHPSAGQGRLRRGQARLARRDDRPARHTEPVDFLAMRRGGSPATAITSRDLWPTSANTSSGSTDATEAKECQAARACEQDEEVPQFCRPERGSGGGVLHDMRRAESRHDSSPSATAIFSPTRRRNSRPALPGVIARPSCETPSAAAPAAVPSKRLRLETQAKFSEPRIFRPSGEIICGAQTGSQTMCTLAAATAGSAAILARASSAITGPMLPDRGGQSHLEPPRYCGRPRRLDRKGRKRGRGQQADVDRDLRVRAGLQSVPHGLLAEEPARWPRRGGGGMARERTRVGCRDPEQAPVGADGDMAAQRLGDEDLGPLRSGSPRSPAGMRVAGQSCSRRDFI